MKLKNGEYAIYKGKTYTSGAMGHGKLVLRSTDIKDVEEKGFEPCKPFQYRNEEREIVCLKYVDEAEVESFYILRTRAIYRGYEFEVVAETENDIYISSRGGDYRVWKRLEMEMVDRGVYEKWVKKDEVDIRVIKEEL